MSERRDIYLTHQPQPHPDTRTCSCMVDLGQHSVEVFDDQTIILVKQAQWDVMVQLESEEAYRLLLVLRELFQQDNQQQSEANSK